MSLAIRAAVTRATRSVVPAWPLSSFIAVNPLSARETEQFADVAAMRSRNAFLEDYRTGRITDCDLRASIAEQAPEVKGAGDVVIGARAWTASDIVAAELIHGPRREMARVEAVEIDPVDELVAKWIAAYLDPDPMWKMPGRDRGIWSAWVAMARFDPQLPTSARRRLHDLPDEPDAGLALALSSMGVGESEIEGVLRLEAQKLPGWVAHIKWRAAHRGDIDLTSVLAIRVSLHWALGLRFDHAPTGVNTETNAEPASVWERADELLAQLPEGPAYPESRALVARILALHPPQLHAATWQGAYEHHYRQGLVAAMKEAEPRPADAARIQVVMCIDPRSEGMRRQLEVNAHVETFGSAGFFGVPIRFSSYQARGSVDALPALLAARHSVTETTSCEAPARRRERSLRFRNAVAAGVHAGESVPAAPFALADVLGWFFGASTILRTLSPGTARAFEKLRRRNGDPFETEVTVSAAFSLEERVALAETSIRMMGLDTFSALVVFAGHESTSANNLYQSALDCGACGGNPGAANARAAAAIFNDVDVRRALASRGLPIPQSTFFVAAEHNTVSDHVDVLDRHLIPASHEALVSEFSATQGAAADRLIRERARTLPGASQKSLRRLRERAADWAEVYPELGLAGNAAMVIGPRDMTRGVDLARRAFLHSYRAECDPDGSALETIMTAPLVVAQWINHQYYFSTVDQNRWGAGTKTIHNAIGTIGVLSGQTGDLMSGLPQQSVAFGDLALHEPMRLSVFIQAPLDRIAAIISRNQVLRNLFHNGWISLAARCDQDGSWYRYASYGWIADAGLNTQIEGERP